MDIGLVPFVVRTKLELSSSLNPYSCGYRTGTQKDAGNVYNCLCLNPYSCGYRTGTGYPGFVMPKSLISLNPYSCGYRTGTTSVYTDSTGAEIVSILILVDIGLVHSLTNKIMELEKLSRVSSSLYQF